MAETLDRTKPTDGTGTGDAPHSAAGASSRVPLIFLVDDEPTIRHFLSLILHGAGIDTEEFPDGGALQPALARRTPDLVFLSIGLESSVSIETIVGLGKRGYPGYVQLMSSRGSAVLEHVKSRRRAAQAL